MNDVNGTSKDAIERRCCACRERAPARALSRWVLRGGRWTVDPGRRLPGRGVSVHTRHQCVVRMVSGGGWLRPWRARGIEVEVMGAGTALERLDSAWRGEFAGAVRRARRRHQIVAGAPLVRSRLPEVQLLWISEDADVDVPAGLEASGKVLRFEGAAWMRTLLDDAPSVVAVTESAAAKEMLHAAACVGELRRSHE